MYCMKCGKKVPEKHVFCEDCLAVMEQFPVKLETHVVLPIREEPDSVKKSPARKRVLSTEERLSQSKKIIQWLSVTLAAAVLALFLSVSLLIETITPDTNSGVIGQNYNTTGAEKNTD